MKRSLGTIAVGAVVSLAVVGCGGNNDQESQPAQAREALNYLPDFTVTSVQGPASVQPGQPVTVQVQVCNQGTADASTNVEVYLSADAVITPMPQPSPDSFVGMAQVPWLVHGQCTAVTVTGPAYPPPPGGDGAYYLGAVADPQNMQLELNENNNTNSGYRMGVGNRPDFTVTSVQGPTSAQPGQQVTAQVQVCNQGTQDGQTNVEVYLSADATITPNPQPSPDKFVGGASTPWLIHGQCAAVTVSGPAYPPGGDGVYYLGAYADPQNMQLELIEDNNSNSGYRMGVGYRPDFTVKSITGPASAQMGQQISAQVQVCNQGTQDGQTRVEVYLSADAVITPNGQPSPDSFVGGLSTPWLLHGQCATVTVNGPAYPPPPGGDGAYYLGAVADPQNMQPELIEDNNANSGYRMGVGNRPDFTVKSVAGPTSAQTGQQVTAQVQVCNQGTTDGSTNVEVYLSADAVITPNGQQQSPDSFVGGASTPWLMHGQCATVTVNGPAYPPPPGGDGAYYLGAVADPQNNQVELIEDNNANSGYRMGVGNRPDFTVKTVAGPTSAQTGQQVTAQVQVCNQGTTDGSTNVEVYLSADAVITPMPQPSPDSFVGVASTPWLIHGQCATVTVSGPAYPPAPGGDGAYYLGAVADPQNMQPELIEDNNTNSGYRMGVGNRPDFTVKSVAGPTSAQTGQQVTVQVQVCNQGTTDGSTNVEVYLSADAVITPMPQPSPDFFVGVASTPWLMHGQCATVTVNGPAYPPPPGGDGAYYLGAVADPQNSQVELIEDNNANSGYRMGVGNRPDFTVKTITGPASAQPGQQISAQVQVCNQGTTDGSTNVEVYLSADAVITPNGQQQSPDSFVGGAATPWLMHGQCATVTVNGPAYPPPPGGDGAYYLGAVADPQNMQPELIEDNNTNSYRLGVGNRPDFTVASITGPASASPGQQVTAQVQVCNQGTTDGSTNVEVYLSADAVITPNGQQQSPDSFVGGVSTPWLMHGQCATVTVNGPAYPPPPGGDGAYYLGAVADPQNMQPELIEDNNANSGYRMGVGNRPDFTVTTVTGPTSAQPGQQVSAQVQVCNQGTTDGSTNVEVYLSADAVITPNGQQQSPDSFVGGVSTPWLMHGQCATVTVNGPAYPPPPGGDGAYYLGAVADPQNMQPELIEDNNANSGYRMGVGNRPDFTVRSVVGPTSAMRGQQISVQVQVCNQGTQDGSTNLEVYLSADAVITPNPQPSPDSFVGGVSTPWLMHGQCALVTVNGPANPPPPGNPGTYYLGAVADPQNTQLELIEDNNTGVTSISLT